MLKSNAQSRIQNMVNCALMTGLLSVLAPWSIPLPFSPVPLTLASAVVMLGAALFGPLLGTLSAGVYILIGCIGLPVFSGFSAGPGQLIGPTGGYLVGYLACAAVTGWFATRFGRRFLPLTAGMALGMACCYALGSGYLASLMHIGFYKALLIGVLPYLPGDIGKILACAALAVTLDKRIKPALWSSSADPR